MSKAKLIHEWVTRAFDKKVSRVRLVENGENTSIIEREETDALGATRWVMVASFTTKAEETLGAVVDGMKDAVAKLAAAQNPRHAIQSPVNIGGTQTVSYGRPPGVPMSTGECLMQEGNCKAADCKTHGPIVTEH